MNFYQMRFYAFAYLEYILPCLLILGIVYTIMLTKWLKRPKKSLYDDLIGAVVHTLNNTSLLKGSASDFIVFHWIIGNTNKYRPILDDRMKYTMHKAIQKRADLNHNFKLALMSRDKSVFNTLHLVLISLGEELGRDFKEEFKIVRRDKTYLNGKC